MTAYVRLAQNYLKMSSQTSVDIPKRYISPLAGIPRKFAPMKRLNLKFDGILGKRQIRRILNEGQARDKWPEIIAAAEEIAQEIREEIAEKIKEQQN